MDRFTLAFRAIDEPEPGPKWHSEFERSWPAHRNWFLRDGDAARPSYLDAERAFTTHMPELLPVWQRLVTLAGGGDLAARYLAQYRPPSFFGACSQLLVTTPEPVLVRSYDYSPRLIDGLVTHTTWCGRRVIGMSDSLIGLLDGMNERGLALSLAFGGRRVEGDGFGMAIVLRYVLETCATVGEACAVLKSIPIHLAYNIAVLDRNGDYATVAVAPDREPRIDRTQASTNHQGPIDWPEYAAMLETEERCSALQALLAKGGPSVSTLRAAFMAAPLYRRSYSAGYGTLYTAAYFPERGEIRYWWLHSELRQSFAAFSERAITIEYLDTDSDAESARAEVRD